MRNTFRLVALGFLVSACSSPTPTAPAISAPVVATGSSFLPTAFTSSEPSELVTASAPPAPVASSPVASISLGVSQDPAFVGDRLSFEATSSPTGGPTSLVISSATIDFGDGTSATAAGSCAAGLGVAHTYPKAGDYQPTVTKIVPCDPSQAADLSYADAMVHVFPAAPADTASWPVCSTFQLQFAGPWTGAGLGNVATLITMRNVGSGGCSIEGYPQVILVAKGGRLLPTHDSDATTGDYMFPAVVPHRIALAPGKVASFMIGSGDNPFGPAANEPQDVACPQSLEVRVILPTTAQFGTAHVAMGACGGVVRVSPIVPGAEGLRF